MRDGRVPCARSCRTGAGSHEHRVIALPAHPSPGHIIGPSCKSVSTKEESSLMNRQ